MARIHIKKVPAAPAPANNETVNKAGGRAFLIQNASERLVHVIGHFFNEPKFYGGGDADVTDNNLDSEAVNMIETCKEVLNGPTPEDLFVIASWARDKENGLKLRSTPVVCFATAAEDARPGHRFIAASDKRRWDKALVAYAPIILARADEPATALASWIGLWGTKGSKKNFRDRKIPNSLKKAITRVLLETPEDKLAKYAGKSEIALSDVIKICCPEHIGNPKLLYFVNKEAWERGGANTIPNKRKIAKYFDPKEATPILWARHQLAKLTVWNDEAQKLADAANVEWEFLLSVFGKDMTGKRKIWETMLPKMGQLALIKNLRNITDAGVPVDKIVAKLTDLKSIKEGGLLPFRYLMAAMIFGYGGSTYNPYGHGEKVEYSTADPITKNSIVDALGKAMDLSIANMVTLEGRTAILVDVSGSMDQPLSQHGAVNMKTAAAAIAALFVKINPSTVVVPFSTTAKIEMVSSNDSALTITQKIKSNELGGGTNTHEAIELLTKSGIQVDRIIILSDCQAWSDNHWSRKSVQSSLGTYRAKYPNVWLHSVNLAGTTDTPASPSPRVNLMSGFSEKVFNLLADIEGAGQEKKINKEIPSLEVLRERYSLNVLK